MKGSKVCGLICAVIRFDILLMFMITVQPYFDNLFFWLIRFVVERPSETGLYCMYDVEAIVIILGVVPTAMTRIRRFGTRVVFRSFTISLNV